VVGKYSEDMIPLNSSTFVGIYEPTSDEVAQGIVNKEIGKRSVSNFPNKAYVRYIIETSDVLLMRHVGVRQAQIAEATTSTKERTIVFVEIENYTPITYALFVAGKASELTFKDSLTKILLPEDISRTPGLHETILINYLDPTDIESARFAGFYSARGQSLDNNLVSYKKNKNNSKSAIENKGA
jgi:hypothetical protein